MNTRPIKIIASMALVVTAGFLFVQYAYSQSATKVLPHLKDKFVDVRRGFSYNEYAATLSAAVNDQGMVNYKGLKANRKALDSFAISMGNLDPSIFEKWPDEEKIAFWINAYNAFTLIAIIDNYPIKSSFLKRRFFPANSIRQIDGVWKDKKYVVMGRKMSLDEIEHSELRAKFDEPRIHMALVCAAMSCPRLRNEPFYGAQLDAQLEDQTRDFLANATRFSIDRENGKVTVSEIFKWFGKDFVKSYGKGDVSSGNATEKAVRNFIAEHLDEDDAEYLRSGESTIEYFTYDWSLNEQKG